MGRASTLNGNGRAVLPPPVLDPMRRYQQPPPPSRSTGRLVGKVFGWIVLVVLVVGSGLAGGLYLYGHETLSALGPRSKEVKKAQKDLVAVPPPSEPATALVVGYDQRAGSQGFTAKDSRSDTLMLVRADPHQNTLSLLSFPRDLDVPIYCNSTSSFVVDRINSAWSRCGAQGSGPQGTLDTVQKLTGIPINYLITIDFHGFKLIVNKLHGIYINVDHRYINTQGGTCSSCYATINLHPGYQKLDGQQALDFVRSRHTDNDLYRNARQQLFLEALKDRLATGFNLLEIPKLIGALKHNLEIARGGSTGTPSMPEIQSYVGLGYHLKPNHMFRVTINNLVDCGAFGAQLCTQPSDIQAAVDSFMHPDVTLPARANRTALGRKPTAPKQPLIKPSEISTLVLNGTSVAGLAGDTSYKLAMAGFHTVQLPPTTPANTPQGSPTYTSSYVYFDPVQAHAKEAASQLKDAMGPNTLVAALPPQFATLAQQAANPLAVVVVGTAFGGDIVNPQAHVVQVTPRQPPNVRNDVGATLAPVQQVRAKVPFPIMIPHVLETSSHLSSLEGVRAFKPIAHKHELALTYVTGAGNIYWDVIETNWTEAPILRHETDVYKVAGRKFHLFTTGGHIHMIVLYKGAMSYWVVNTLRDELSNETMLAIAKGLQPLGK
ncbi:MAG: polyisoprenyl-teichoic acid--peptidoglycan teichoic acid transferase [Gaiellaceae bacterium]|jgi:LCP family protein required for cell wall assembly|nr:polyisoprenyl-teichoic acid--peptidoglycan teichoic acid transferase [Gaiellaceae bacterium]